MLFDSLNLIDPILKSLKQEGYTNPTPIQAKAIPAALNKKDIIGCAQTGTGKTAAYALPILQLLSSSVSHDKRRNIRSLLLAPTRELAVQVGESFRTYGRYTDLRSAVIYGGVSQQPQVNALRNGVDILVATPGRLLDLMNQGFVNLSAIEIFVLDEADRMLDMGFIHDIRKVISLLPAKKQSLFFSATMSPEVVKLAGSIVKDPVWIEINPSASTTDLVDQFVYFTDKGKKNALLFEVLKNPEIKSALVFTRTKFGADRVAEVLRKRNIVAESIHGNKAQNARQRALSNFKDQRTRVLVATDIAARGLDVEDLNLVINYEIPNVSENYVHRIGRTGRAGAAGTAISFCDADEKSYLRDIEKLITKKIQVVLDHPFVPEIIPVERKSSGVAMRNRTYRTNEFRQRRKY